MTQMQVDVEDDDEDDHLRCTDCGDVTDETAGRLYERMGKTRSGKWRKGNRWLKTMTAIVEQWRCNRCLDAADANGEGQSETV